MKSFVPIEKEKGFPPYLSLSLFQTLKGFPWLPITKCKSSESISLSLSEWNCGCGNPKVVPLQISIQQACRITRTDEHEVGFGRHKLKYYLDLWMWIL